MKRRIGIVGGGPGGSSFALRLVGEGIDPRDVVVLDKARFPRPKLCGGGITFRGTGQIEALLGALPGGGGSTRGLEFRCALGRFPVIEPGRQWVFDRGVLDDLLLAKVRDVGIEVREGVSVTAVHRAGDGYRLACKGAPDLDVDWLVGADGATSLVRRELGLEGGRTGRLVEAVYEPEGGDADDDLLVFDFDPILEGIPGYAWIFPYPTDGTRKFKLGVMDGRGIASGERLRAFLAAYASREGFRLLEPKVSGWPEHYYAFGAKSSAPRALLTGEAFGIDPLLGEGITPAIEVSAYAARRLSAALRTGRASVPFYELGYLATSSGWNLAFQTVLANRLYGRHPYRWLRVLFENPALRAISGSGSAQYGRLSGRSARMTWSFVAELLRAGPPSNEPIVPTYARPRST